MSSTGRVEPIGECAERGQVSALSARAAAAPSLAGYYGYAYYPRVYGGRSAG